MRRGEIWRYDPVVPRPGQSVWRLIVSADEINESETAAILGVHVVAHDPCSLLAPRVGEHGWAVVLTIERVLKSRLVEPLGRATEAELEQVGLALRACLALD